jgi:hypothetical protein
MWRGGRAATSRTLSGKRERTLDRWSREMCHLKPAFSLKSTLFALKIEFVLSSFFATFVDSKGLVEFVPSI